MSCCVFAQMGRCTDRDFPPLDVQKWLPLSSAVSTAAQQTGSSSWVTAYICIRATQGIPRASSSVWSICWSRCDQPKQTLSFVDAPLTVACRSYLAGKVSPRCEGVIMMRWLTLTYTELGLTVSSVQPCSCLIVSWIEECWCFDGNGCW